MSYKFSAYNIGFLATQEFDTIAKKHNEAILKARIYGKLLGYDSHTKKGNRIIGEYDDEDI